MVRWVRQRPPVVSLVLLRVALEAFQELEKGRALHQRLVYGDVGLPHGGKAVKEALVQIPARPPLLIIHVIQAVQK